MKYTLKQRLDIGRRIYEGELTRFQAAEEYGINDNTARNYMWLYRDTNHLPPKNSGRKRKTDASKTPQPIEAKQPDFESYESMTKEELAHHGLNQSSIHVDFMVGTKDLQIDATTRKGKKISIFQKGNFPWFD